MIINLDYNDEVYIGKNTHVAYIEEELVECNYIEVCESIETTECQNWMPKRNIINSNLVYSPAQVTAPMSGAERPRCAKGNKTGVQKVKRGLS